jgi:uncharacterized RDD family membrane protein YckC
MKNESAKQYAGFWSRVGASLIDVVVIIPCLVLVPFASRSWPTMLALLAEIVSTLMGPAYSIYCHGRYGQTIGKRLFGIRVRSIGGTSISWRAAWIRDSLYVIMSVLNAAVLIMHSGAHSPERLAPLTFVQWSQLLVASKPAFMRWTEAAEQVWAWSEPVVMLLNKQRRALHDFIAGTIVLSTESE